MHRPLSTWLATLLCAALATAQDPAAPPATPGATPQKPAPAKQGPQQPGKAGGNAPGKQGGNAPGQQGGGAGGKQAPGGGAPGKQGPNKPGAGGQGPGGRGGRPGQPGRPGGARAGQRARAARKPVRPETLPPELASTSGSGDPIALALADDGARLYSLEGTTLVTLDTSKPNLPELARVPLDAAVLGAQAVGKELYLAAGSAGLGVLSLEPPPAAPPPAEGQPPPPPPPPPAVEWIDTTAGKPCTAVAVSQQLIVATFASERDSELRVYLRGTRALAGKTLLAGRALDIALRDTFVYLAMGPIGVVRADLRFLKQPKLERGPDLTNVPAPENFHLKRGFAREVALGGTRLYVAADVTGLVEIDLEKPWGTTESFTARPLSFLGRPAYAVRVDARGDQVAVGTARVPAIVGDGAPWGLLGGIAWDLTVGGALLGDWQPGASEAMWVFQHPKGGELELAAVEALEDSTWRGLALRGRRVYEQHVKLGVVVRELALEPRTAQVGDAKVPLQGSVTIVGRRKPRGIACLDGKPSLQDPRLFFFGVDPQATDGKGILRMGQGERLQPVPELAQQPPLGTAIGAQWLDALTSREWLLASGPRGWRIHRFTHRPKLKVDSWDLVPPEPPDVAAGGSRGRSVFHSVADGDLLIATRDGTRFGLVGYSIKQLDKVLNGAKAGTRVMPKPLWQLQTHFEGERPTCSTWRPDVFALEDGRRILAIAAGANTDPESEHFETPQLVLYDVSALGTTTPKKLAVAWGDEKQGLAVSVDTCQIRRRSYAVVATTGGQLLVFDVNDPAKPRLVRSFKAPVNPYDGKRESLMDVEIASDTASGRVFAYVAAGRAGLIRVELSATGDDLAPDAVLETPGFAAGVTSTVVDGERYWLVGDQRAGLRLYR